MIKIKELNVGKYYWHRDSPHKGFHPAYIYKKNTRKNKYFHLNFITSKGKGRRKLLKNLDGSKKDCYILNNPQISKRKSFTYEIVGLKPRTIEDKAIMEFL